MEMEIPVGYTEEHARSWVASARDGWKEGRAELAIDVDGAFAGAIGLVARQDWIAEIGYWIAPTFRGRGLAPRALELISTRSGRGCSGKTNGGTEVPPFNTPTCRCSGPAANLD
jgi:RimJ/RimL family protein N-acetyltransferase